MKIKFLLSIIVCTSYIVHSSAQYQIGHANIQFIDSSRNNRSVPLHIFYPANDTSLNTPVANGIFPLFIFAHGIMMEWSVYDNVWTHLVPKGYIVALPETETTFSADFNTFGTDVAFSVRAMREENQQLSSLFYGKVGTAGAGGHSMGGAAAILAVNKNPDIITTAGLAPTAETANAFYDIPDTAATVTLPSIVLGGSLDCMAPPATHGIPIYDTMSSTCKVFININGGNHCQFAQAHTFCQSYESGCGPPATISRALQHAVIDKYLSSWLDYTLKGNMSAWAYFSDTLAADTQVTSMQSCVNVSVNENNSDHSIFIYPNPGSGEFQIDNIQAAIYDLEIYNTVGAQLYSDRIVNHNPYIVHSGLPGGMYFLNIKTDQGSTMKKIIIQK